MPKVDFPNNKIPEGYKLPETPIILVEEMDFEQVKDWVYQELYKIYNSNENYFLKEMSKEDIYEKIIEKNYNFWQ